MPLVLSDVAIRGKKDNFFLASQILGGVYPDLTVKTHKPFCDFFVQKISNKTFSQQDTIKNRLLMAPRGHFKPLDVDTPIPTPNGFKLMGHINVGDTVFGVDGMPTKVIGVSPIKWSTERFKIEFSTGEKVVCDSEHLWETDARRDRDNRKQGPNRGPQPSVKTTKQISESVFIRKEHNHRVRVCRPLQMPERHFSISPYVLGAWLGDGTSSCGNLTCDDQQIIEEIRKEGEVIRKISRDYMWTFNGGKGHREYRKRYNSFAGRLRAFGLINNKHIPQEYMRGSFSQRLDLLQGLMDTDGSASKEGQCNFNNTNRRLVEQVRELAASLGYKPSAIGTYDEVLNGEKVGIFHVVSFYGYRHNSPFRLERKIKRLKELRKVSLQNYRQIVSVEPCAPGFVRCIMVDSAQSLYLVSEGFIPTHNTSLDLVDCVSWLINFPNITILMLSGSQDVASRMVEELKQVFLGCEDFRSLYPDYIPIDNVREFGAKGEFLLPRKVRTRIRREPSLSISTLDSTKASTHYDIIISDDVVNEINSRVNPNQRIDQNERVAQDWNATRPLLNPGGYRQVIGTFYNFSCLYGKILDRLGLSDKMEFGRQLHAEVKGWKISIYPALEKDENGNIFNQKGILFPEKFCINATTPEEAIANADKFNLQEAWEEDPTNFNGQYQNHPIGTERDYFPIELLQKQTIPRQKVPMNCVIFGVWDLAYKQSSRNDYTVGAIGAFDELKNIYIIDLFRGRWNPPQIIDNIIAAWKKWPIQRMGIEQAVGATLLGPGLSMRTRELGLMIPMDWLKVSNKKDATANEILSLATLLGKPMPQIPTNLTTQQQALVNLQQHDQALPPMGKLFFCSDLPFLAELYTEFARFGGGYSHDDIPRACSLLLRYHGQAITTTGNAYYGPVEIGGAMAYGDDPVCGGGIVA